MKCLILFSGKKIRKNIISILSAEACRVVKVKSSRLKVNPCPAE